MSVEDGQHKPMAPEVIDRILEIIELRPEHLDDFEKALLNDRLKAIQEFGLKAVATEKQMAKLRLIFKKVEVHERSIRLEPL